MLTTDDARRTTHDDDDDGGQTEDHPKSSPWHFVPGELKIITAIHKTIHTHIQPYIQPYIHKNYLHVPVAIKHLSNAIFLPSSKVTVLAIGSILVT